MHFSSISRQSLLTVCTVVLFATGSWAMPGEATAQNQLSFPGEVPDRTVARAQRKAEMAYDKGDFAKAFWFYRKELAPIGDKYAQYMVGYMLHHGQGVPKNEVEAAAWFSLAAERGHKPIVEVVAQYRDALSSEQMQAAKAQSLELQSEIGDVALVKRLIRRDMQRLREVTGSRTSSSNCDLPGRIYTTGFGSESFVGFCDRINRRIETRLEYVGGYIDYGELELLPDEQAPGEGQSNDKP